MPEALESRPSIPNFLWYFLGLGTVGFGGPIALAGRMERDLVEQRRWIAKEDYLKGLALAQMAPGPLAAQLAMYLGWLRGRALGAALIALAFILPSFLMVLGLSMLYLRFGGLSWMQGVFYGVGAAVIALIARSAFKLAQITVRKDLTLVALFVASAALVAWTQREVVGAIVACGILNMLAKEDWMRRIRTLAIGPWLLFGLRGVKGPATGTTLARLSWYFFQAGAVVFGSGLAIVPFLHSGVVDRFHWLTQGQFLDAVAVAMITPGPVVITSAFIGYLVAGPIGSCLAAGATFLPCYLVVVLVAPHYSRVVQSPRFKAVVDGITAGATGAIAGAVVVLGRRAIVDVPTAIICLATLAVLIAFKKVPEPLLIAVAAGSGLAIRRMGGW